MIEYYDGTCCVSARRLIDEGIISASNYKQLVARGKMTVVRPGKGLGNYALIALDSIPERYLSKIKGLYPGLNEDKLTAWVLSHYTEDTEARNFGSVAKAG